MTGQPPSGTVTFLLTDLEALSTIDPALLSLPIPQMFEHDVDD